MSKHKALELAEKLRTRNGNASGFGLGPVCDEAAAELRAMHDREQRQHALIVQMREALVSLLTEQNGPPLVKYEKEWNEAIRLSRAATSAADQYLGEKA